MDERVEKTFERQQQAMGPMEFRLLCTPFQELGVPLKKTFAGEATLVFHTRKRVLLGSSLLHGDHGALNDPSHHFRPPLP